MVSLNQVIRQIRKRLHKTTAEFGRDLGVSQPMVSRYEAGRSEPPTSVVKRLLDLADKEERSAIWKAVMAKLAWTGPELIENEDEVQRYFEVVKAREAAGNAEITGKNAREAFQCEVELILSDDRLMHPLVVEILRYWRKYANRRQALLTFLEAGAFLDVRLSLLDAPPTVARRTVRAHKPRKEPPE